MIRAASRGMRLRFQSTKDWLAADRRWAIAAIALLGLVILTGDSEVDLAPIVLSAVLVTVGIALVRSETPATSVREESAAAERREPRVRRPRSKLFPLTLAAAFAALGILLLLDITTTMRVEPGRFPALALVVVGGGLLLGGWWGRARLLILLGVMLIPVVLLSSLVHVDLSGRIGSIATIPVTPEDLPERLDVVAGGGMLDLTHLRLRGQNRVLDIEMGFGEIDVLLPQRFRTDVSTSLGAGSMWVLGRELDGTDLTVTRTAHPELAAEGTLTLLIDAGAGSISVDQAWWPPNDERKTDRRDRVGKRSTEKRKGERQRDDRGGARKKGRN